MDSAIIECIRELEINSRVTRTRNTAEDSAILVRQRLATTNKNSSQHPYPGFSLGGGQFFLPKVVPLGFSTKIALLSRNLNLDSMNSNLGGEGAYIVILRPIIVVPFELEFLTHNSSPICHRGLPIVTTSNRSKLGSFNQVPRFKWDYYYRTKIRGINASTRQGNRHVSTCFLHPMNLKS